MRDQVGGDTKSFKIKKMYLAASSVGEGLAEVSWRAQVAQTMHFWSFCCTGEYIHVLANWHTHFRPRKQDGVVSVYVT